MSLNLKTEADTDEVRMDSIDNLLDSTTKNR